MFFMCFYKFFSSVKLPFSKCLLSIKYQECEIKKLRQRSKFMHKALKFLYYFHIFTRNNIWIFFNIEKS